MKEIELPVSVTSQISIDTWNLPPFDSEGKIQLGSVSFMESVKALAVAKKNGAQVVFAAIDVSQKIERIVANYFFGQDIRPPKEKSVFQHEIMENPQLTFQFKKELLKKIIKEENLFEHQGKDKSKLYNQLDAISTWRNAFAHGGLVHDANKGVILSYYSNGPKSIELNEQYWKDVEESFGLVQARLDELLNYKFVKQPR